MRKILITGLVLVILAGFAFSGYRIYESVQEHYEALDEDDKGRSSKKDDDENDNQDEDQDENQNDAEDNNGGQSNSNQDTGQESNQNSSGDEDVIEGQQAFINSKAYTKEPSVDMLVVSETYGEIIVNQYMIILEEGYSLEDAEIMATSLGGSVVGEIELINLYQLELPVTSEEEVAATIDALRTSEGVEDADVVNTVIMSDVVGKPCTPYNDPAYDKKENSEHYDMIRMTEAWKIIKASGIEPGFVDVGVLDTAIYTGSTELDGLTIVDGDTTTTPDASNNGLTHGTMVTHVIGADPSNGGVTGIAGIIDFEMDIQVNNLFDGEDWSSVANNNSDADTTFAHGNRTYVLKTLVKLKNLIDGGATVINCSFNVSDSSIDSTFLQGAYTKFLNVVARDYPKVVIVASAGNDGRRNGKLNGKNALPAGIPHNSLVTVGSVNTDGTRADYSNYQDEGGEVTLSAPGSDIMMGVDQDGNPVKNSGTSFSAPQVTATIALMQSLNPDLTAVDIKKILKESAQKTITKDGTTKTVSDTMGAGVLDVSGAVLKAINKRLEKEGKDPITLEDCLQLTTVESGASGAKDNMFIYASVPKSTEGTVTLVLSVEGNYEIIDGELTQTVKDGEQAAWSIDIKDKSVKVKITRLDTEGCSTMELPEGDFEGEWDYVMSISEDTLTPKLALLLGEAFEEMATEMGCEVNEEGEISIDQESSLGRLIIKKVDEANEGYSLEFIQATESDGVESMMDDQQVLIGYIDDVGDLYLLNSQSEDGFSTNTEIRLSIAGADALTGELKVWFVGNADVVTFTANDYIKLDLVAVRVEKETE